MNQPSGDDFEKKMEAWRLKEVPPEHLEHYETEVYKKIYTSKPIISPALIFAFACLFAATLFLVFGVRDFHSRKQVDEAIEQSKAPVMTRERNLLQAQSVETVLPETVSEKRPVSELPKGSDQEIIPKESIAEEPVSEPEEAPLDEAMEQISGDLLLLQLLGEDDEFFQDLNIADADAELITKHYAPKATLAGVRG